LIKFVTKELEEAEIELELIEKEKSVHNFVGHTDDTMVLAMPSCKLNYFQGYCCQCYIFVFTCLIILFTDHNDGSEVNKRLQQIRENIRSL
jgi:hypothetical protein